MKQGISPGVSHYQSSFLFLKLFSYTPICAAVTVGSIHSLIKRAMDLFEFDISRLLVVHSMLSQTVWMPCFLTAPYSTNKPVEQFPSRSKSGPSCEISLGPMAMFCTDLPRLPPNSSSSP